MRKFIAVFLTVLLLVSGTQVFAIEFPKEFWSVSEQYGNALAKDDYYGIIRYGQQLIDMVKDQPNSAQKRDILSSKYDELGRACIMLGDYSGAEGYFGLQYEMLKWYPDEYPERFKNAQKALEQFTSRLKLYTDGGTPLHFGAKNERTNGVLFGACSDGAIRKSLDNESMVLVYHELGYGIIPHNKSVMQKADSDDIAVEYALNCPNQGADIRYIKNFSSELYELSKLFSDYSDVPVFLRFGAEFDIWSNKATPQEFISAFQYVAQYFKSRNSNVAIVWSPSQAASYGVNVHDYYPGDAYVDWVGLSSYADKYLGNNKNASPWDDLLFKKGPNSSAVIAIEEFVKTYGDRKPIMLSEMGCGHKSAATGENTTAFATQRFREYYTYIPMVYPQVKLIAYFDNYISGIDSFDYSLSNNSTLKNEYLTLTKGERFIQGNYYNNSQLSYREITDGTQVASMFMVSAYAHIYNDEITKVTYFIDDAYVGESSQMPFATYVNGENFSGSHTLKAVAQGKSGKTVTTYSVINIKEKGSNISVYVSGKKLSFDQEPIIYNDRTMVPLRKIFESLGATVNWNASTRTVTGTRGDRRVKLTVGSKTMYVNNTKYDLDTAPIIVSDRTLVPARAVAEGLGCDVSWDASTKSVNITPKVFSWSGWDDDLPSYVTEDLYYIEEKEEYRYRDFEYFELGTYMPANNYVKSVTEYGDWSSWSTTPMYENSRLDVETRTVSSPKSYHYAHYCTGHINDSENRYMTSDHHWHDECVYHDIGWYSQPLQRSPDTDGTDCTIFNSDGSKYRCSNSCFRWYLIETSGGDYTEYRCRTIDTTYIYREWSGWSDWDEDYPYGADDIDERTVYRYKEK